MLFSAAHTFAKTPHDAKTTPEAPKVIYLDVPDDAEEILLAKIYPQIGSNPGFISEELASLGRSALERLAAKLEGNPPSSLGVLADSKSQSEWLTRRILLRESIEAAAERFKSARWIVDVKPLTPEEKALEIFKRTSQLLQYPRPRSERGSPESLVASLTPLERAAFKKQVVKFENEALKQARNAERDLASFNTQIFRGPHMKSKDGLREELKDSTERLGVLRAIRYMLLNVDQAETDSELLTDTRVKIANGESLADDLKGKSDEELQSFYNLASHMLAKSSSQGTDFFNSSAARSIRAMDAVLAHFVANGLEASLPASLKGKAASLLFASPEELKTWLGGLSAPELQALREALAARLPAAFGTFGAGRTDNLKIQFAIEGLEKRLGELFYEKASALAKQLGGKYSDEFGFDLSHANIDLDFVKKNSALFREISPELEKSLLKPDRESAVISGENVFLPPSQAGLITVIPRETWQREIEELSKRFSDQAQKFLETSAGKGSRAENMSRFWNKITFGSLDYMGVTNDGKTQSEIEQADAESGMVVALTALKRYGLNQSGLKTLKDKMFKLYSEDSAINNALAKEFQRDAYSAIVTSVVSVATLGAGSAIGALAKGGATATKLSTGSQLLRAGAMGAGIMGTADAITQGAEMWDGTRKNFDVGQTVQQMGIGAVGGPVFSKLPPTAQAAIGLYFGHQTIRSGVGNIQDGHYATGTTNLSVGTLTLASPGLFNAKQSSGYFANQKAKAAASSHQLLENPTADLGRSVVDSIASSESAASSVEPVAIVPQLTAQPIQSGAVPATQQAPIATAPQTISQVGAKFRKPVVVHADAKVSTNGKNDGRVGAILDEELATVGKSDEPRQISIDDAEPIPKPKGKKAKGPVDGEKSSDTIPVAPSLEGEAIAGKKTGQAYSSNHVDHKNVDRIFAYHSETKPAENWAKGVVFEGADKKLHIRFWNQGEGTNANNVHHRDTLAHLLSQEAGRVESAALALDSEELLGLADTYNAAANKIRTGGRSQAAFTDDVLQSSQGFQFTYRVVKGRWQISDFSVDSGITSAQSSRAAQGLTLDAGKLSQMIRAVHNAIDPSLRGYKVIKIKNLSGLKLEGVLDPPDGLRVLELSE